jgi:hypothetical protein
MRGISAQGRGRAVSRSGIQLTGGEDFPTPRRYLSTPGTNRDVDGMNRGGAHRQLAERATDVCQVTVPWHLSSVHLTEHLQSNSSLIFALQLHPLSAPKLQGYNPATTLLHWVHKKKPLDPA